MALAPQPSPPAAAAAGPTSLPLAVSPTTAPISSGLGSVARAAIHKSEARDDGWVARRSVVGSLSSSVDGLAHVRRAVDTGPVAEGYPDCSRQGNDRLTCYPESNTTVVQNEWSKLIWNANIPSFIAADNRVDVYLFLASSDALVQTWTSLPNEESQLAFQPTSSWWENEYGAGDLVPGANRSWEAYFLVVPGGQSLVGTETHQPTFAAIQTALPSAASASRVSIVSTSSVAGLSSVSAQSTASARSASARASISSLSERIKTDPIASQSVAANGGLGNLQGGGDSDNGLPKYAIALLSVLGALLLITVLALTWFLLRRLHKRRSEEAAGDKYARGSPTPSFDASFASRRPIINLSAAAAAVGGTAVGAGAANRGRADSADPQSPTSPYGTATDDSHAGGTGGGRVVSPAPAFVPGPRSVSAQSSQQPYPTAVATAAAGGLGGGAATMRPHPSFATSPLSESDAASISAAFRSALAHPEFGPVDDGPLDSSEGDSPPVADDGGERMRRELEREGIGLRGVPGGRGGQTVD